MTREVVFRLVARQEFEEAVAWYEDERAGLGLEFKDAIHEVIGRIVGQPAAFRVVRGRVRRAIVSRFP